MKKTMIKKSKWVIIIALCGILGIVYSQWNTSMFSGDTYARDFYFLNEDTGFIAIRTSSSISSNEVLRTKDGGLSWDTCLKTSAYYNWAFNFVNDTLGFIVGRNPSDSCGIFKTIDGGDSWNEIYTSQTYFFHDIAFINKDTGYAVGYGSHHIYQTVDGGYVWNGIMNDPSASYFSRICFPNSDTGYAIGYAPNTGFVYRSTDKGFTWTNLGQYPYALNDLHFFNGKEGIIAGSGVLYTTSAGNSFTIQDTLDEIDNFDFSPLQSGKGIVYATGSFWGLWRAVHTGTASKPLEWLKEDFIGNPFTFSPWNICIKEDKAFVTGGTGYFGYQTNLITDSVWPGDANYDNIANVSDVLSIGVAYGDQGSVRTGATGAWVGQACSDWPASFNNNVNHKHADCDGNGTIDSLDVYSIASNYGLTHYKTFLQGSNSATDPDLYIESSFDTIGVSNLFTAKIKLGTNSLPLSNAYGFALSISYNPLLIDSGSLSVNFNNSWMASKPDYISLVEDFYSSGQIDIGFSRIDQSSVSGYGEIAELSCIITDNIDGKDYIYKALNFEFLSAKLITETESDIPVNVMGDSVIIQQESTSINNIVSNENNNITVFPSPFSKSFVLTIQNGIIDDVILSNIFGQSIPLNASKLANNSYICSPVIRSGTYFLKTKTVEGTIVKKIVKQ